MKLLCFDSAFKTTGYAVLDDERVIEYGLIKTSRDSNLSNGLDRYFRIAYIRQAVKKLIDRHSPDKIVIEVTDWGRGSRDSRSAWITETKAREALAIGTTTLFSLCLELRPNDQPIILGPREWMSELGVQDKDGAAHYVAMLFRDSFELSADKHSRIVVLDAKTKSPVPRDVTDAIALGVIARNRIRLIEMAQA